MKNNVLEFKRPKKKKKKEAREGLGRRISTAVFFILFALGVYLVTSTSFDGLPATPPSGPAVPR